MMKNLLLTSLLLMALTACTTSITEKPATKIGEGVEIYKVLLTWDTLTYPGNRWKITSTKFLNDKPMAGYDNIVTYGKEPKEQLFYFTFTKPANEIITGQQWAVKPDTGFAVTLNKKVIYTGYYKSGFAAYLERDVYFWNTAGRESLYPPNSIIVNWDSIIAKTRRTDPDTRFDKQLLDKLRQDGKLYGF